MSTEVVHPYITSRGDVGSGRPVIVGTRTRVSTIIAYYKLGLSPEELAGNSRISPCHRSMIRSRTITSTRGRSTGDR